MKTKSAFRSCVAVRRTVLGVLLVSLVSVVESIAQQPKVEKKEVAPSGYLNKISPPGLRFAPPPKPPVAYLPPLPITYDPQPVFTPEFASPMSDLPKPPSSNTASAPAPNPVVPGPERLSPIYNNGGNKQSQIPVSAGEAGVVSPQMLVKFFQAAQPAEVQMLMNNPVSFKAPLPAERPSSSATYEVK
jgi:hypothetical protein